MKGEEAIITGLNDALSVELTAINQYFIHSRMMQDWGYLGLAKKMHEESIGEMRRAVELDPDDADAWGRLGLLYGRMGRLDEARMARDKAVQLDPKNPMVQSLDRALRGGDMPGKGGQE